MYKTSALVAAAAVITLQLPALAQDTTLSVAAFEGGYGREGYIEVVKAFEALNPGLKVDLLLSKTLPEELTPRIAAGDFPDVVILGQGGKAGLTENMVRDKALEDLTGVLDLTVPGESVTVGSKLTPGIVGNLATNPYGDDKIYLMPMNASSMALVYDQGLFDKKGWKVPTDWDQLFDLAEKSKAEGIATFTYAVAGYLDGFFPALIANVGGEDFYKRVANYERDIWLTPEARKVLDLTAKLLSYASPTTVGYANGQDFTKNQQSILDDATLFMPNGAWIVNEMKDGPRPDTFKWGFMPVPAAQADGTRYVVTGVEAIWVPAQAKHKDVAKQFIAFMYSDQAAAILAKTNAIQPIKGLAETLTGDAAIFYAPFSQPNVKAIVAGYVATKPVPGVDIKATLYDTANSIIQGTTTVDQWQAAVNEANNKLAETFGR